jgi:penicillin-binding protein 2
LKNTFVKKNRVDLEKRILATSLQSRYAKLGLSEAIKLQLRIADCSKKRKQQSCSQSKIDTTKTNKQAI